jgi:hypothetical protein
MRPRLVASVLAAAGLLLVGMSSLRVNSAGELHAQVQAAAPKQQPSWSSRFAAESRAAAAPDLLPAKRQKPNPVWSFGLGSGSDWVELDKPAKAVNGTPAKDARNSDPEDDDVVLKAVIIASGMPVQPPVIAPSASREAPAGPAGRAAASLALDGCQWNASVLVAFGVQSAPAGHYLSVGQDVVSENPCWVQAVQVRAAAPLPTSAMFELLPLDGPSEASGDVAIRSLSSGRVRRRPRPEPRTRGSRPLRCVLLRRRLTRPRPRAVRVSCCAASLRMGRGPRGWSRRAAPPTRRRRATSAACAGTSTRGARAATAAARSTCSRAAAKGTSACPPPRRTCARSAPPGLRSNPATRAVDACALCHLPLAALTACSGRLVSRRSRPGGGGPAPAGPKSALTLEPVGATAAARARAFAARSRRLTAAPAAAAGAGAGGARGAAVAGGSIAIATPMTSKGTRMAGVADSPFFNVLLPSLLKVSSRELPRAPPTSPDRT